MGWVDTGWVDTGWVEGGATYQVAISEGLKAGDTQASALSLDAAIAEGLKQIEDGVEKIQRVMREENIKSIKEVAAELIPMLKADDDEINESIIRHLDK